MVRRLFLSRKARRLLAVLCLTATLVCASFAGQVWATEGEGETPQFNTKNNLINENTDITPIAPSQSDIDISVKDGVFSLEWDPLCEYGTTLYVPHLTRDFTMSGKVSISDVDVNVWNGVRFIIGFESEPFYNIVNVCVNGDIQLSARDEAEGWHVFKTVAGAGPKLTAGTEFTFQLDRNDLHVTLLIDGKVVMEGDIEKEYDWFMEGEDNNIGLYSSNCTFTVTDLAVYDDNAVLPTPTPTAPPATETPGVTPTVTPTKAPTASPGSSEDAGDNTTLIVILVVCVVVVAAIVVAAILVGKKKKK